MAKESYEKWMEMIEDLKWTQACEHQENFEKAAALAISPFSKSEEESRFIAQMVGTSHGKNYCSGFFIFPIKMNPETISIPNCTLDNPVKNSSGKISFCLLPCLHKDERLQVKLPTRFKIYSHPGNGNGNDSFSLGISIPENSLEFFRDLEKHLNALAMKKTKEVEKIGRSFARYDEGYFSLLKVDKSEQEKILCKDLFLQTSQSRFLLQILGSFAGLRKRNLFPIQPNLSTCHSGDKLFSP